MYRERPARPDGAIAWTRSAPDGETGRVLPDGCMDVLWLGGELVVAGPDTHAQTVSIPPGTTYAGLRFAPGAAPALLGVPAHELRDRRVRLAAIWPDAEVRRLAERVAEATDPADALSRLLSPAPAELWVADLVAGLRAGHGVHQLADRLALSERQLHRRCLTLFGYGPKTLARVLRMERALDLARRGVPFGAVAAETGYADQAHLARDVKALAGVPMRALVQRGA
jgi:AraC-like DNA-binding protein